MRLRDRSTGMVEEAFLDSRATFAQDLELQAGQRQHVGADGVRWCGGRAGAAGGDRVGIRTRPGRWARPSCPPSSSPSRCRSRCSIAAGSASSRWSRPSEPPCRACFECICRTQDQAGRIVVPIYEENRVVKQMVIEDLDPDCRSARRSRWSSRIDVKHKIEVSVRVRGRSGESEPDRNGHHRGSAAAAPAHPGRDRAGADADRGAAGSVQRQRPHPVAAARSSHRQGAARSPALRRRAEGDPAHGRAARFAAAAGNVRRARCSIRPGRALPSWCATASTWPPRSAEATGRDRQELFEHVQAQERYAEQAYEEHNQPLYRECRENLEKYAGYLEQLLRDTLPRPPAVPTRPPRRRPSWTWTDFGPTWPLSGRTCVPSSAATWKPA